MMENRPISPNYQKNFIIAKAYVDKKTLLDKNILGRIKATAQIEIVAGYSLYFLSENNSLESIGSGKSCNLGGTVSVESLNKSLDKFGKLDKINLYWVRDNKIEITVPWGFGNYEFGGLNGKLILKIKNLEEFIKKSFFMWERELRDGIQYDYLTEYFIDSERKQNGISIDLRDEFYGRLKSIIEKNIHAGVVSSGHDDELNKKIREDIYKNIGIKNVLTDIGLAFDDDSDKAIVVNLFLKKDKSKED